MNFGEASGFIAVVVAAAALYFARFRYGRLEIAIGQAVNTYLHPEWLIIPSVITNTGASPRAAVNARLFLGDDEPWSYTASGTTDFGTVAELSKQGTAWLLPLLEPVPIPAYGSAKWTLAFRLRDMDSAALGNLYEGQTPFYLQVESPPAIWRQRSIYRSPLRTISESRGNSDRQLRVHEVS